MSKSQAIHLYPGSAPLADQLKGRGVRDGTLLVWQQDIDAVTYLKIRTLVTGKEYDRVVFGIARDIQSELLRIEEGGE